MLCVVNSFWWVFSKAQVLFGNVRRAIGFEVGCRWLVMDVPVRSLRTSTWSGRGGARCKRPSCGLSGRRKASRAYPRSPSTLPGDPCLTPAGGALRSTAFRPESLSQPTRPPMIAPSRLPQRPPAAMRSTPEIIGREAHSRPPTKTRRPAGARRPRPEQRFSFNHRRPRPATPRSPFP